MNLDIRVPIGLLFGTLGALLAAFGLATSTQDIYKKSLDINVNLWWGLVMLAFGALMFFFGRRKTLRSVEKPPSTPPDDIVGVH